MNKKRTVIAIISAAFAFMIGVPAAHASASNQLTRITFNQPIQVPSVSTPGHMLVLTPGTYELRVAPTTFNDSVVQIYNANQTKLLTTVSTSSTEFVASNNRELSDQTQLTFAEGKRGTPLTLVKWFYPERNIGHRFIYNGRMQKRLSHEERIHVEAGPANYAVNATRLASATS